MQLANVATFCTYHFGSNHSIVAIVAASPSCDQLQHSHLKLRRRCDQLQCPPCIFQKTCQFQSWMQSLFRKTEKTGSTSRMTCLEKPGLCVPSSSAHSQTSDMRALHSIREAGNWPTAGPSSRLSMSLDICCTTQPPAASTNLTFEKPTTFSSASGQTSNGHITKTHSKTERKGELFLATRGAELR